MTDKECTHEETRFLDCSDCKEKGKVCEVVVCCDCGETVNE
jgi:hypothetical protein